MKILPTPACGHPSKGGELKMIPSWDGQGWVGRHDISITGRVLFIVLLLWVSAFVLACHLLNMPELQKHADAGLIAKLLGNTRFEISELFFEQADRVFHKGVGHYRPPVFTDWFSRMRNEVAPYGHVHLHKEGILEIMPWLYFATRADPGNVTAYTATAFWLAREAGRPDLAEGVLNEALRNNPGDYRVYMEKGNLAVREGKYAKASRFFDAALALFQNTKRGDKAQMRIDLAEMLTYRGLLYELEGNPVKAAHNYREVVDMFPGRLHLKERMLELEKNGRSPTPPEELAGVLMFQHRHVCAEEEDQ